MDGSLRIESGIPIPLIYKNARTANGITAKKMQIGQSVLVGTEREAYQLRDCMRYHHGEGCYRIRKLPDGWRIWRLK